MSFSLASRISWSTKSNALAKSKNIANTVSFRSFAKPQSSMTLAIASIVHLPGRKPCCLLLIHIFFVVSTVYFDRTLSKVLHRFDVNDIGL